MASYPNDPLFAKQWGLRRVKFPEAWASTDALEKNVVRVGLIDTGVAKHEDLPRQLSENLTTESTDKHGHGTWVAGILCAERNNGLGIAGAVSCELRVYKVVDNKGWNYQNYYDALEALQSDGVKIVNLSLGGEEKNQTEQFLISQCVAAGIIVVAAAGNHRRRGNPPIYPAALDGVIAVAAITQRDQPTRHSSSGAYVFIAAPGESMTTGLRDEYRSVEGSSFAAPVVTAAIALALGVRPHISSDEIRRVLGATADDVTHTGKTADFGYGILDVARFIQEITR